MALLQSIPAGEHNEDGALGSPVALSHIPSLSGSVIFDHSALTSIVVALEDDCWHITLRRCSGANLL